MAMLKFLRIFSATDARLLIIVVACLLSLTAWRVNFVSGQDQPTSPTPDEKGSRAAFLAAATVLAHPRCVNCHAAGDKPTQNENSRVHKGIKLQRGDKPLTIEVAVLERPKDPDRILSLVRGDENLVPQLGILAVDLDERATPLLPPLRRLSGVVVAGVVTPNQGNEDNLHLGDVIYSINGLAVNGLADLKAVAKTMRHGQNVALYIERLGQLQYLTLDAE